MYIILEKYLINLIKFETPARLSRFETNETSRIAIQNASKNVGIHRVAIRELR